MHPVSLKCVVGRDGQCTFQAAICPGGSEGGNRLREASCNRNLLGMYVHRTHKPMLER